MMQNYYHTFAKKIMQAVLIIHSLIRWAILILGLIAVIKAIGGISGNRPYSNSENKTSLFFMVCCDIQFILGLLLYFGNSWFDQLKDPANMKIAGIRFFTVEHSIMMIIAWILVHVGRVAVKKAALDLTKHKRTLIFFGLALIIILAAIPWPIRQAIARPLFRFS